VSDNPRYQGKLRAVSLEMERHRLRRIEAEAEAQRMRIDWLENDAPGVHDVYDLDIGPRPGNALHGAGIFNVPQLLLYTRESLTGVRGLGAHSLDEIEFALLKHGFALAWTEEES
jgi:DNA-directed RNA polymerase alpha subunit